jgi:myosin protein heavy chain
MEEKKAAQEKVKTLGGRLSFLLNKMQADEEAKVVVKEEMQKMAAQIKTMQERNEELSQKLQATGESNRIITQAMRFKQEELDELAIKHEALQKTMQSKHTEDDSDDDAVPETAEAPADDAQQVRESGGRGRFNVESKPAQGLLLIRAKRQNAKEFLEKYTINQYLKRAQKSANVKQLLVEKVAQLLGLLMVEEEETGNQKGIVGENRAQIEHLSRKTLFLQDKLGSEEDTKRRTLLRYVHAVKAAVAPPDDTDTSVKMGSLQLPESGIGNEEVHAIAALLRGNTTITELNVRGNNVTDEGARALAAVLAGRSQLRQIDLRGNHIGKGGIRAMAEALERGERVRHVYVHAGGKIEALGTGVWAAAQGDGADADAGASSMVTVETVCVVDCRENTTEAEPEFTDTAVDKQRITQNEQGVNGSLGGSKKTKIDLKKVTEKKKDRTRRQAKKKQEVVAASKNRNRESDWQGRAGGFDSVSKSKNQGSSSSLPPLSEQRSQSAPALPDGSSSAKAPPYARRK